MISMARQISDINKYNYTLVYLDYSKGSTTFSVVATKTVTQKSPEKQITLSVDLEEFTVLLKTTFKDKKWHDEFSIGSVEIWGGVEWSSNPWVIFFATKGQGIGIGIPVEDLKIFLEQVKDLNRTSKEVAPDPLGTKYLRLKELKDIVE